MAKFVMNSTGTRAVRKEEVKLLAIDQMIIGSTPQGEPVYGGYELKVVMLEMAPQITFETGETLEAVQSLASPILTALEE